jgi:hypothetical protein
MKCEREIVRENFEKRKKHVRETIKKKKKVGIKFWKR